MTEWLSARPNCCLFRQHPNYLAATQLHFNLAITSEFLYQLHTVNQYDFRLKDDIKIRELLKAFIA